MNSERRTMLAMAVVELGALQEAYLNLWNASAADQFGDTHTVLKTSIKLISLHLMYLL